MKTWRKWIAKRSGGISCPAAILLALTGLNAGVSAETLPPSSVKIEQTGQNEWQLLRNGQPYYIHGGGGQERIDLLAKLGGNSLRTWGLNDLKETDDHGKGLLDRAHALDLTVTAGIWVGHPRHGFDYNNKTQVEAQRNHVREMVRRYKDHPALLIWGLGNEVETEQKPEDYPQIFKELNVLAGIIKEEDPNHPVMTSIANINLKAIEAIIENYPALDILGINAYGAARKAPEIIKLSGWTGPYIMTEFGPNGPWESPNTSWGAPIEPTPLQKIEQYQASYDANIADPRCIGLYPFRWGAKQELTATWFGLLLPSGEKTPPVDYLSMKWTGKWPENQSPVINTVRLDMVVSPGSKHTLNIGVTDPEKDSLTLSAWVMEEAKNPQSGGDVEEIPKQINNCFKTVGDNTLIFTAPYQKGNYRAFIKASDGHGGACIYPFPFRVE